MIDIDYLEQSNKETLPPEDQSVHEFMQVDEKTLRQFKLMALRRGIDYQSIIRAWARRRLEVELRKMTV